MKSRVPLATSSKYMASQIRKTTASSMKKDDSSDDFGLFDEQNLLDLEARQTKRERFVRDRLSGKMVGYDYGLHENGVYDESSKDFSFSKLHSSSIKSNDKSKLSQRSRVSKRNVKNSVQQNIEALENSIESLKKQIEKTKKERLRVIAEGEKEVKSYKDILMREQSDFSNITRKMRSSDEKMNSEFLREISDLDRKLGEDQESIEEIKRKVKQRIEETRNGSVSIQSIQVSQKGSKIV